MKKTLLQSILSEDKSKDEKENLLSWKGLCYSIKEEISFYPPGTKITHFGEINNKQKIENYVIDTVTFNILECCPLYNISRRYIDEDSGKTEIYRYYNESDKFFSVARDSKKWKLKMAAWDIELERADQQFINTRSLFEDTEFMALRCIVTTELEYLNNEKLCLHKLTTFKLDRDLNVFYGLDNKTDFYYSTADLLLFASSLHTVQKEDDNDSESISKVVPYMIIEKN